MSDDTNNEALCYLKGLISKFPLFSSAWSNKVKHQWLSNLNQLLKRVIERESDSEVVEKVRKIALSEFEEERD